MKDFFILAFLGCLIYSKQLKALMRTLIFIALFFFIFVYWTEISNYVSATAPHVNQTITQWFVDHTPKK
jgi:hypothetical protein